MTKPKAVPKAARTRDAASGRIRVGIGGWTFEPWRGTFYPAGLAHKRELEFAGARLGSIEVNGTFYRLQTPATFARWREETPDDFVFSLKAPRFVTHRKLLSTAGEAVLRFLASGIVELGAKLGPINWQLPPEKLFEPGDFGAFLELLPPGAGGRPLRHVVEVRHESFCCPEFIALVRRRGVAVAIAGDSGHPQIADLTAPFVYARIMGTQTQFADGYSAQALDGWAQRAAAWASGRPAEGLNRCDARAADRQPRDVYLYVISGCKERNPAAAMRLIERLA